MSRPSDKATVEAASSIRSRVRYADIVPSGVGVLVVDGDSATLAIASRMLLMFGYKVFTAKSAGHALFMIQEMQGSLDLILTEIHLPDADKFEVLEKLGRVSNLPVIIMTADNNESTMLGALINGASLYLLKPIRKLDIRDLWQFSFIWKRDQMARGTEGSTDQDSSEDEDEDEPESQPIEIGKERGEARPRKGELQEVDGDKEDADADLQLPKKTMQLHKKTKLTWTNELHDKFLRAVRFLGIESAHPKTILQHMNVPGLRKGSVSSHLQKYRRSLKREQDTILKTVHPESYRLSFPSHLQGLLSFSGSHLQATAATTKDSRLPSCFQSNPDIPLVVAHDRDREPWNYYSNWTSNPIANPIFMPSDQLSRSSFRTGEEAGDTANVLSIGNNSCSAAEIQSSGTGEPSAPKVAAGARELEEHGVWRGPPLFPGGSW